eukprot:jgi/Ulvmu1/6147/UM028_0003.1
MQALHPRVPASRGHLPEVLRKIKTNKSLKGILFDVDGTLAHSDDLHYKAFMDMLQNEGFQGGEPISREFFNTFIAGRHNPEIAADLFPGKTLEQRQSFSEEKEAYFREIAAQELAPIPGLLNFLRAVDAHDLRKVAVTNAPPRNVELMLAAIGLADYFEDVVFGEQCMRAKPHPEPYLVGLQRLSLSGAGDAVVFEDSPSGVRAGVAAGLPVVALATTQAPAALEAVGACMVIEDYHGIMPLLETGCAEA